MMNKRGLALGQVVVLLVATISFAYLMGMGEVSGEGNAIGELKDGVFTSNVPWAEGIGITTRWKGGNQEVLIDKNWITIKEYNYDSSWAEKNIPREATGPAVAVTPSPDVRVIKAITSQRKLNLEEGAVLGYQTITNQNKNLGQTEVFNLRETDGKYYVNDDEISKGTYDSLGKQGEIYTAPEPTPPIPKSDQYAFDKFQLPGTKYGQAGHLIEGLVWGVGLYGFVKAIGGIVAADNPEMVNAIAEAGFMGVMAFKGAQQIAGEGGWLDLTKSDSKIMRGLGHQGTHMAIGALVAWAWYTKNYGNEETFTEQVSFQCLPWQAPRGGQDCELCNDGELPCSEYRCKSLGQSCAIINKGTAFESCVNQNPRDTNPPVIKPWEEILTEGYAYNDIKLAGVKIQRTEGVDKCIKAFTPIEFGIVTDEPSQCKIDIEYKDKFEEMAAFLGGDNVFKYNHSDYLTLPKAKDVKNSSITLEMGNEMTLYIRCADSQGNLNQAPYAVRFCVDSAPDATPPQIKATSVETGSCVAADRNSTQVSFYTDEPSQCKWGFDDQNYDSLPYNMSCTTQIYQVNSMMLYTCTTELSAVSREGTDYYVRCEDNQNEPKNERNAMQQSFQFSMRGSNPLKLKTILPNGTLYGGVSPMRVDLRAETLFGCDSNKAVCFYSPTGQANSYVKFFDTDKADGVHTQRLDLYAGTHTYFVKCVDAGGNVAESNTTFTLDIDTTSPIVTRAYYAEEYLRIVTARDSDCVYSTESCDFLFEEGQIMPYQNSPAHIVAWEEDKTFYIKCRDEFRNEPIDCSIIVRPKENFLYY